MRYKYNFFFTVCLVLACLILSSTTTHAQNTLAGLNTSGTIYEIATDTGVLTEKADDQLTSFTLGAFTRKANILYYIAAPSGASEDSIYTVNLDTGVVTHVDLDRDDSARALWFKGANLYAVFYNTSSGASGVYQINLTTGTTTQILDLTSLAIEPIGGAFAQLDKFYYIIGQPSSNSDARKLIKFKLRAGTVTSFDIVSADNSAVLCNRLQLDIARPGFICLAAPTSTQVDVCKLSKKGKAKVLTTLSGIRRVAGGSTMTTKDGKTYYAIVYAEDEVDNQRLIKFNIRGVVKSNVVVDTIIIGARFKKSL